MERRYFINVASEVQARSRVQDHNLGFRGPLCHARRAILNAYYARMLRCEPSELPRNQLVRIKVHDDVSLVGFMDCECNC
jgi:hypothetical protein